MVINYSKLNEIKNQNIIPKYHNIFGRNKKTFFQRASCLNIDAFNNKGSTYYFDSRLTQNGSYVVQDWSHVYVFFIFIQIISVSFTNTKPGNSKN